MTEKKHGLDPATLQRLKFIKWLEERSGRPDRHGVQTPLPVFESESVEPKLGSRRTKSFIPDNTTGV